MTLFDPISGRDAVIELAQGLAETSYALMTLTTAVRRLADRASGLAGPGEGFEDIFKAIERSEEALGGSYHRAVIVLEGMANDA